MTFVTGRFLALVKSSDMRTFEAATPLAHAIARQIKVRAMLCYNNADASDAGAVSKRDSK